MSEKKFKYYNLGNVMVAKKENDSDPTRHYIKLEQSRDKNGNVIGDQIFPITLANGVVLNDGDTLSLYDKRTKLKQLVEQGKMSQDTADKLSFIKYEVVARKEVEDDEPQPKKKTKVKKTDEVDF